MARATLTAHHLNPELRAGMNIRFDRQLLAHLKNLGVPVFSFDRSKEPQGVKTMEWGIKAALKKTAAAPVAVYDVGAPGKEAMIRIFGRSTKELEALVFQLLNRLSL